jgi:hypothetical protein
LSDWVRHISEWCYSLCLSLSLSLTISRMTIHSPETSFLTDFDHYISSVPHFKWWPLKICWIAKMRVLWENVNGSRHEVQSRQTTVGPTNIKNEIKSWWYFLFCCCILVYWYLYWCSCDSNGEGSYILNIWVNLGCRSSEKFEKYVEDGGTEEKGNVVLSTFWEGEMLTMYCYNTSVYLTFKKSNLKIRQCIVYCLILKHRIFNLKV